MLENIRKTRDTLLTPVSKYRTFFIFMLLMSNITGAVGNLVGAPSNAFLNFLLNIFDAYVFCAVLWMIDYAIKSLSIAEKLVRWAVYILLGTMFFSELFIVLFSHTAFSVHVMLLLLETSANESSEFVNSALSSYAFWMSLGLTSIILALSYAVSWKSLRVSNSKTIATLRYIILLLILWSGTRQIPCYIDIAECFKADNTLFCAKKNDDIQLNTPATRILFGTAFNKAASEEIHTLEKIVAESKVNKCTKRCPLIVLVIGESYNKYHSHIYNKEYRNNTPYLDALEETGNLIKYTDAITPYNMTSHVFKYLFSMYDQQKTDVKDGDDSWTQYSLFPALFKKAGYNVYFLTNQFVPDSNDDWDTMGGTFLNNRILSDLQFTWRNKNKYEYDGELLGEIPDIKTLTEKPTLLIVHLIGQHVDYSERYPECFRKFSPSSSLTPFGGETGKKMESGYANAVLYNDYVVNKVFSLCKDVDAIGLYFADHGEEVFDWRNAYERTQERPIPMEVMRYQYDIPMMFYVSDCFKKNHPDIVARIEAAKEFPALNINMSHTLLWLGGIESPEYNAKLDILSSSFDKRRKRILWDSMEYKKIKD